MSKFDWYPCRLEPLSVLDFEECEILPGLKLAKMPDWQKHKLKQIFDHYRFHDVENPNLLLRIDNGIFEQGVVERLRQDGKDVDAFLASAPLHHLFPCTFWYKPVRWISACLALNYPFQLVPPTGILTFEQEPTADNLTYPSWGKHGDPIQTSSYVNLYKAQEPFSSANFVRDVQATESFYRTIFWKVDRISIALGSFWAFIFSPFMEQGYVSLITILESLLYEKSKQEIAHQIAERAALLLAQGVEERLELYATIKNFYNLRSEIAHGGIRVKKGPINWGKNIVSAPLSIISASKYGEMARRLSARRLVLHDCGQVT